MNAYTGVGSRETPPTILKEMHHIAYQLAIAGWMLRSGGANGADTAFEHGCDAARGSMEIYLPWGFFNHNPSLLDKPSSDAMLIAAEIHNGWKYLKEPARLLMARNVHQVLGEDLKTPSKFLVCYTKDGCTSHEQYSRKTGGTGLAIAVASLFDVPVFNMHNRSVTSEVVVDFAFSIKHNVPLQEDL